MHLEHAFGSFKEQIKQNIKKCILTVKIMEHWHRDQRGCGVSLLGILQKPWHGGTALGVPVGTGIGPAVFHPQYSATEWAFPCVTYSLVLWDARQWQSAGGTKGLTAVLGCWVLLCLSSCPEVEKQNDSAGPQHQIAACEWGKTRWHGASFQGCGSHQAVGTWMQLTGKAVEK